MLKMQGMKKSFMRFAAAAAAVLTLAAAPWAVPAGTAHAATLAELQSKSEQLKKEANAINAEIAKQEKNMTDEQAYLASLTSQIENAKAQIALLDDQVTALNRNVDVLSAEIQAAETEIEKKQEDIDLRMETLRSRLRYISKTGTLSPLQMLLDTDDYTEYLVKSKVMGKLAESSQEMMDELNGEIDVLNGKREKLNEDKAEVAEQLAAVQALKNESESKKRELDTLYAKSNASIKRLSSTIDEYKDEVKRKQAEMDATYKEILNKIAESSGGQFSGGTMLWPVPAVKNLSSYFGNRKGGFHRGIDIANGTVPVYGKDIIAAADGVVVYANSTSIWGGGYGYYVTINHGYNSNGVKISTLYAHMSKVLVSSGQSVKAGTVIGKAGDTGDVTGPHLHFEVHENGIAVDPIAKGYIKRN